MPITSGAEYIESLRGRDIKVYLFGELIKGGVTSSYDQAIN